VTFLIDQQLPIRLKAFFLRRRHVAVHVKDLMLAESLDIDIWRRASTERLIVVTKDKDYNQLAETGSGARLLWIKCGNCSNEELEQFISARWPKVLRWLETSDPVLTLD